MPGMLRKVTFGTICVGLASTLIACGNSASQLPSSDLGSLPSTKASYPLASSSPSDTLTGFGATVSAWNAHHEEDTDFAPGSVYDPNPSLPSINGHTGATYVEVTPQDGRATDYIINISGLPIHAAIERAQQELPPDVRELWGARRDTCYQAELSSRALGQALGSAAIGDPKGDVFVEFDTTFSDGSAIYRSTDVNEILIGLGSYATADSAPAC